MKIHFFNPDSAASMTDRILETAPGADAAVEAMGR